MTALATAIALGTAGYYLIGDDSANQKQASKNDMELREAMHTGFLRSANVQTGAGISSEETRVIRLPGFRGRQVRESAGQAWKHYKERNDQLASIGFGANNLINRQTLRPDNRKKPGLPMWPNREAYGPAFGNLPNATFDIPRGIPADQNTFNWRDQYGDAGGFPREGRPNVVLNELYVGNPWGTGGQLFEAVGNEYRDPQYADNPPDGRLPVDEVSSMTKFKKRVHWQ